MPPIRNRVDETCMIIVTAKSSTCGVTSFSRTTRASPVHERDFITAREKPVRPRRSNEKSLRLRRRVCNDVFNDETVDKSSRFENLKREKNKSSRDNIGRAGKENVQISVRFGIPKNYSTSYIFDGDWRQVFVFFLQIHLSVSVDHTGIRDVIPRRSCSIVDVFL